MKSITNSSGTASEQIEIIANLLRNREKEGILTYFSIAIEQGGKIIPTVEKEQGAENFTARLLKNMSDYDLNVVYVYLYTNKAKNAKPMQTYKLLLKKHSPVIVLGNTDSEAVEEIKTIPDNNIPVHRYYDEKLSMHVQLLSNENEKNRLLDRITQIQERHDYQLKEKDQQLNAKDVLLHSKEERIKELENIINQKETEIKEFEKEIGKYEQNKKNSLGNISIAGIASHAVDNLLKSPNSTGFLKGLLGTEGYSRMQEHILGGTEDEESEEEEETEPQTTGGIRIIPASEQQQQQPPPSPFPKDVQVLLNNLKIIAENLPKKYLYSFHEIGKLIYSEPLIAMRLQKSAIKYKQEVENFSENFNNDETEQEEPKTESIKQPEQLTSKKDNSQQKPFVYNTNKTGVKKGNEEEEEIIMPPLRNVITTGGRNETTDEEEEEPPDNNNNEIL